MFKTVFLILVLISELARAGSKEDWMAFRAQNDESAKSETGYFAIQNMLAIKEGEASYLQNENDASKAEWSKKRGENEVNVRVEYTKDAAWLFEGSNKTDLLKLEKRTKKLKSGLIVRASFLNGREFLKVWLYNPEREQRKKFSQLPFFDYSKEGIIKAKFISKPRAEVAFLDSQEISGKMSLVGLLKFNLQGKAYEFKAYNHGQKENELDYIMIFFRDHTSGKETYGAGRVVDMEFPKGKIPENLEIDFNRAYNFLCAHSKYYNCPLSLTEKIEAEVRFGEKYKKN